MTINNIEQAYDALPYISQSFKETHPQKLESIARLISLDPPAASEARVLEIGCSFGGNLIPFALNNKNADVVGIDLSGIQISKGQKIVEDIDKIPQNGPSFPARIYIIRNISKPVWR